MSWNFSAITAAAFQSLANYLGRMERSYPVTDPARVVTTDATVTTLFEIEVPVDETLVVEGLVATRRTGGSSGSANDGAGYKVLAVAKNTSGTAAVIGSSGTSPIGESQAGWDVTVDASGNTIRIRVTGAADNTISWVGHFKTLSHGGA